MFLCKALYNFIENTCLHSGLQFILYIQFQNVLKALYCFYFCMSTTKNMALHNEHKHRRRTNLQIELFALWKPY